MRYYSLLMLPLVNCISQETTHNMTFIYQAETIPQLLGTDCASKGMQTCGSTGPNVCWENDIACPGYKPNLRGSSLFNFI